MWRNISTKKVWNSQNKKTTWQNSDLMQSAENMLLNVMSFDLLVFLQKNVVEIFLAIVFGKKNDGLYGQGLRDASSDIVW